MFRSQNNHTKHVILCCYLRKAPIYEKEVTFLKDMIIHPFKPVKFYKKFRIECDTRENAESHLLGALSRLCQNVNKQYADPAKRLIGRFDSITKSKVCEDYWNGVEIRQVTQRTKKRAIIHKAHIEYNVYEEHDSVSNAITNRLESDKAIISDYKERENPGDDLIAHNTVKASASQDKSKMSTFSSWCQNM